MASTATLVYTVTPTPPVSLARTQAALAAVELSEADMVNFGATLDSDNTSNDGTNAIRTIVFNISSANFASNFPSGQEASPFNNLFTSEIAGELGMVVVPSPVVIA